MNVKFENFFKYLVLVVIFLIVCIIFLELGAQTISYLRYGKFHISSRPWFHEVKPTIPEHIESINLI